MLLIFSQNTEQKRCPGAKGKEKICKGTVETRAAASAGSESRAKDSGSMALDKQSTDEPACSARESRGTAEVTSCEHFFASCGLTTLAGRRLGWQKR